MFSYFSKKEQDPILTEQFFNNLATTFKILINRAPPGKDKENIVKEIQSIISVKPQQREWSNALRAELLLTELYDLQHMQIELGRKVLEAKTKLGENAYDFFSKLESGSEDSAKRVLQCLLKELHWESQMKYSITKAETDGLKRLSKLFLGILVIFVTYSALLSQFKFCQQHLSGPFCYAALSGALGASFSMLIFLRNKSNGLNLEKLKTLTGKYHVMSRIAAGIGAAIILMYLTASDFINGQFIPIFEESPHTFVTTLFNAYLDFPEKSKVVLISFLAGFTERLVPDMLDKTSEKIG